MNTGPGQEIQYRLLKLLSAEGSLTQREMSKRIGVSLGIVNFFLSDLTRRGLILIEQTRMFGNRLKYRYLLTSAGMEEKTRLALNFLKLRIEDYEKIKSEIRELAEEVAPADVGIFTGRAKRTP
ncbi:MAG: MarR family EPS-associated transcriptional regulator [Deltaproteobacteria bacterium HGW-Deltaproteobacteria-15]|jgi:EPS-associated MarR family transcriptional regulator|nr:MAG: MarR family EPS-associated transcriptional regulator [Deltaproteobacteria bacterium HGW-Deltaproteobacteria-15]